jgi:glycosyltransferase involved in cell wall biosynthesis
MPDLMRQFDILVLPSIWEEPLARVMQEAMATGLLVVGTNTGGTGEVLIDGATGLVFPKGDAAALAQCLETAAANPDRAHHMAANGRRRILEHFSLDRMVDEMESYLEHVTRSDESAPA